MLIGILRMKCKFYGFPINSKNNRIELRFSKSKNRQKKFSLFKKGRLTRRRREVLSKIIKRTRAFRIFGY